MPFKIGGGNHLQPYDDATGQYDEEEKARINEEEKQALVLSHYFKLPLNDLVFHFPIYGLHDEEYCDLFVKQARETIKSLDVADEKMLYLLTHVKDRDKSSFLNQLGYTSLRPDELKSDIVCNTDLTTLSFSRFTPMWFKCVAKTTLRGKIVTTVWELRNDFTPRLITIIPGGDK